MLITLNNGKTVNISWEQYDAMSDTEYKYFLDSEYGEEINDPFYQSQVDGKPTSRSMDDDSNDDND